MRLMYDASKATDESLFSLQLFRNVFKKAGLSFVLLLISLAQRRDSASSQNQKLPHQSSPAGQSLEFRMLIMDRCLYISMAHCPHDTSQVPRRHENPCAIVMLGTIKNHIAHAAHGPRLHGMSPRHIE